MELKAMRLKVQTVRCVIFIFLSALLAGCAPKSHTQLIVGMELAYPPFETTDPQDNPRA
jgi:hypothetical protein